MSDATDNSVVQNLAAAVADSTATNRILVQILGTGVRPQTVEVAKDATLSDVLGAAGLVASDKTQYVQGATALTPTSTVKATSEGGPVVVSRAGANG